MATVEQLIADSYHLSRRIYQTYYSFTPLHDALKHFEGSGLDFIDAESGLEAEIYVRKEDKVAYLVFRGSENRLNDWLNNAQIWLKQPRYGNGQKLYHPPVHAGWYDAFKRVRGCLARAIERLVDDGYIVVLTGHSRGGSLAKIAAMYVGLIAPYYCITFGAPPIAKSGNVVGKDREWLKTHLSSLYGEALPSLYEFEHGEFGRYLHFANEKDFVPHILNIFGYGTSSYIELPFVGTRTSLLEPHRLDSYGAGITVLFDRLKNKPNFTMTLEE